VLKEHISSLSEILMFKQQHQDSYRVGIRGILL